MYDVCCINEGETFFTSDDMTTGAGVFKVGGVSSSDGGLRMSRTLCATLVLSGSTSTMLSVGDS